MIYNMKLIPVIKEYELTENILRLFPSLNPKKKKFYKTVLPVTKRCFSNCTFCGKQDSACNFSKLNNIKIISPIEASKLVKDMNKNNLILEIGGSGEPLFNEETFQTLRMLIVEDIEIPTFLTTNGFLIAKRIDDILSVGIKTIKIIINSLDPNIGNKMIKSLNYRGSRITGIDSAFLFQEMQLNGIKRLQKKEIDIVAETTIFPGINDEHIIELIDTLKMINIKYLDLKLFGSDKDSQKNYQNITKSMKNKINLVKF